MIVLGIESSCDDTACAIVEDGKIVHAALLSSQIDTHKEYDGVVPEIAARMHLEAIFPLMQTVLEKAGMKLKDIDTVAVTNRPGLVGSLLVGVGVAKGIAYALGKPIIAVDHIAAHFYSVQLTNETPFPHIGLLVSGGHTILCKITSPYEYELIGTTLDDAVGEAYDKVSKHLGLGYPGGPVIDRLASEGDPKSIRYPISMLDEKNKYNFSYSGLKTAVVYQTEQFLKEGYTATNENIAASFQRSAIDVLYRKTKKLTEETGIKHVSISGGVAANSHLRTTFSESEDFTAYIPERRFTTDNAAMVAGVGYHMAKDNLYSEINIDCSSRVIAKKKRGK